MNKYGGFFKNSGLKEQPLKNACFTDETMSKAALRRHTAGASVKPTGFCRGLPVLFFLAAGAVLLAAGCSKEEPPKRTVVTEETAGDAPVLTAAAVGHAYPLRVGMWLYTIDAGEDTGSPSDGTRAAEALPLGERLELLAAEPRKATNPYDDKVYDYYRVRRDTGKEGLVFANQLTLDSELAVVSDERANLYRSAKNVDASDYILPRGTVLGVFPETEKDGFIRMEAYDPANQAYRKNLFIKTSSISSSDRDIQSSILLQTAMTLDPEKEKNRRTALLDSALNDYPDSIFADDIRILAGGGSPVPVREREVLFRVIDDNVNVRESFDAASRVITQLSNAVEVYVVEETVDEFTVNGQTARWFRIVQPVEGWIFGAWLEDISQ
jgi:hypothetical protein